MKDEDEVFNSETAKEKLKLMEKEFEAEQIKKKKAGQLKPHLWGVYFDGQVLTSHTIFLIDNFLQQELETGAAACQLVRILSGYFAVVMGDNNNDDACIGTSYSQTGMNYLL